MGNFQKKISTEITWEISKTQKFGEVKISKS